MIVGVVIFLAVVVAYCVPNLKKLRSMLLVSIALVAMYMFVQKPNMTTKPLEEYPNLTRVLSILDFSKRYSPGDFEIFVQDVKTFVKTYKQKGDIHLLIDMRTDLLNKLNYLRLSAPHGYDPSFEKALRLLQATTYGMIKKLKQKLHDGSKMFPTSTKNNVFEEFV